MNVIHLGLTIELALGLSQAQFCIASAHPIHSPYTVYRRQEVHGTLPPPWLRKLQVYFLKNHEWGDGA